MRPHNRKIPGKQGQKKKNRDGKEIDGSCFLPRIFKEKRGYRPKRKKKKKCSKSNEPVVVKCGKNRVNSYLEQPVIVRPVPIMRYEGKKTAVRRLFVGKEISAPIEMVPQVCVCPSRYWPAEKIVAADHKKAAQTKQEYTV